MNFDLLRILEPSKKAGLRIPAHFFENAGSPGSAYNFKCVLLPASCFQIRNLGCCGFARKNAGSREQGARPSFLHPASCKTPLSRCPTLALPPPLPLAPLRLRPATHARQGACQAVPAAAARGARFCRARAGTASEPGTRPRAGQDSRRGWPPAPLGATQAGSGLDRTRTLPAGTLSCRSLESLRSRSHAVAAAPGPHPSESTPGREIRFRAQSAPPTAREVPLHSLVPVGSSRCDSESDSDQRGLRVCRALRRQVMTKRSPWLLAASIPATAARPISRGHCTPHGPVSSGAHALQQSGVAWRTAGTHPPRPWAYVGCSSSRMPSGIAGAGAGCHPTNHRRKAGTHGVLVATQPPKEGKAVRSKGARLCGAPVWKLRQALVSARAEACGKAALRYREGLGAKWEQAAREGS